MRWLFYVVMLFVFLVVPPTRTSAEETEGLLNRLLAPGPLMKGHQDLEGSDCLKCHEAGKGISQEKCLECHKGIRNSIEEKRTFHGLATETCIQCHSDHKGRDYDSTMVDQNAFDHSKTGYKLEGKHAQLKCSECHTEKRIKKPIRKNDIHYFGAKSSCVACHKKDDPHHFTGALAKEDCFKCHGLKNWRENLKFDHGRDTHFSLEGKHAELKCSACHKDGKYAWPHLKQNQCLSCHLDFHKGAMGGKFAGGQCFKCHGQSSWKISAFNHSVTGYPLRGRHAQLQCADCHKQKIGINTADIKKFKWTGLKPDCLGCHKDYHRFGGFKSKKFGMLHQCLSCHTEADWHETHGFNHSVNSRFPIEGKHIGVDCNKCHVPDEKKSRTAVGKYHWNNLDKNTCEVCHTSPHRNDPSPTFKNKKCSECHVADDWHVFYKKGKKFNHDTTRFKLTGRHAQISCSACHVVGKKEVFHFEHVDQRFCEDCHKNPHTEQFHATFSSKNCFECHTTVNFTQRLSFDHAQTSFPLKGKHSTVKCEQCHKPTTDMFDTKPPHPMSRFLFPYLAKKDCTQCHADYHNGQLGQKCSSCHNESGWKPVSFDHNKQSRFLITGKHVDVKCAGCHKPVPRQFVNFANQKRPVIHFKPISPECTSCHKDPHKGHFGNNCQECHMDKGWKITKDFHKNFTLSGVHFSLQCQECHRDNRRLAGLSQECILCHQKDDIHEGTLPGCGQCHKQQFWEDVDFKHSLTQFPLRGAHRTLECASCHARGIYQGTSSQCISCHLSDAQTSSVHPQPVPNFTNCAQCHNQFAF